MMYSSQQEWQLTRQTPAWSGLGPMGGGGGGVPAGIVHVKFGPGQENACAWLSDYVLHSCLCSEL